MTDLPPVITIDGPSGSGKGTLAAAIAHRLSWYWLDSGALYRAVAWGLHHHDVAASDAQGIQSFLEKDPIRLDLSMRPLEEDVVVFSEGQDISAHIRSDACAVLASQFSSLQLVREAVLAKQRAYRQWPGLVCDGRDMGTVVFPDATLKLYLDADLQTRAERRYIQLKDSGNDVSLAAVQQDMSDRDDRDRSRAMSPLVQSPDMILIDSSGLSAEDAQDKVWQLVRSQLNEGV